MTPDRIVVLERSRELSFSFADMLEYHGGGSPGGVAHAFKVMQRALPLLDAGRPVQRRAILIETAFGGPGARDAFELVTRAVGEERFVVDPSLGQPEHGRARERFVFRLRWHDEAVTVALRAGFVTDEFIDLTRRDGRSADEEQVLAAMKSDMVARVMAADAAAVYDVAASRPRSRT
ncbi:MAG TPA: hypothetical protein VIK04_09630 [Solirubrobacteraceae bacterium]